MWPFYGATVCFHVVELIDFTYLFHVSLQQNDEVWSQFLVAAMCYYAAGIVTAKLWLRVFPPRAMVILGCTLPHLLIIPMAFSNLQHWYIPLFAVSGLLRVDTFATLQMAESHPPQTRLLRIFHGKVLQYLALLTSSVLVFLMWIYPSVSMYIVGSVHTITLLFGIGIGIFSSPEAYPPPTWPAVSDMEKMPPLIQETMCMEMHATCDFYALSTHALVVFTEHHSQYVTASTALFAVVCLILVSFSYLFLHHHTVNKVYLVYLTVMFLAIVASMVARVFGAAPWVHVLVHLVVVTFFALVHLAPWKVLSEIDPEHNYVPTMIQYRILGQWQGMLLGILPYRLFGGVGVYACLFALNFRMIASYEKAHKKASSSSSNSPRKVYEI